MSTFVPVPEGAQVEIVSQLWGKPLSNTLWFHFKTGVFTPFDMAFLGGTVGAWWNAGPLPLLGKELSTTTVRVTDMRTAGNTPLVAAYVPHIGSDADNAKPAMCAAVIGFGVAVSPGGIKGWNFLAGITDSVVDHNTLSAEWRNNMRLAYADLIDPVEAIGWRWVCVSKFLGGSPRSEAAIYRVDFPQFRSPFVSQRRSRLHNELF